jgi:hypothetical protein
MFRPLHWPSSGFALNLDRNSTICMACPTTKTYINPRATGRGYSGGNGELPIGIAASDYCALSLFGGIHGTIVNRYLTSVSVNNTLPLSSVYQITPDIQCHLPEKSQSTTAGNYGVPNSVPLSLGHVLYMCTEQLPPGGYPIAVNKYISYHCQYCATRQAPLYPSYRVIYKWPLPFDSPSYVRIVNVFCYSFNCMNDFNDSLYWFMATDLYITSCKKFATQLLL